MFNLAIHWLGAKWENNYIKCQKRCYKASENCMEEIIILRHTT